VANTSSCSAAAQTTGAAISGDGHSVASEFVLADSVPNVVGRVARPEVYYSALGSDTARTPLLRAETDDSGSLYYLAFRTSSTLWISGKECCGSGFSVSETISNTATPMAV